MQSETKLSGETVGAEVKPETKSEVKDRAIPVTKTPAATIVVQRERLSPLEHMLVGAGIELPVDHPLRVKTERLGDWAARRVADLLPNVDPETGRLNVADAILKGALVVTAVAGVYYAYQTGKGLLNVAAARTVAAVNGVPDNWVAMV